MLSLAILWRTRQGEATDHKQSQESDPPAFRSQVLRYEKKQIHPISIRRQR